MTLSPRQYELEGQEKTDFYSRFTCISEHILLDYLSRKDAHDIVRVAVGDLNEDRTGVYFWLLIIGSRAYAVYVGKTKDIERRLTDYLTPFQVHSPNDFKLRFFQNFVFRKEPNAQFPLFFEKCPSDQLIQRETELCQQYLPLINDRAQASAEAKAQVKDAFESYYDSIFEKKVSI